MTNWRFTKLSNAVDERSVIAENYNNLYVSIEIPVTSDITSITSKFCKISHSVDTLALGWELNQRQIKGQDLTEICRAIPSSVHTLLFFQECLDQIGNDELFGLAVIPKHISRFEVVGLCASITPKTSVTKLCSTLHNLPSNIVFLKLDLRKFTSIDVAEIAKAIPESVQHLEILHDANEDQLRIFFSNLPKSVSSFGFVNRKDFLFNESPVKLTEIFSSIPEHIVSLNLCGNLLNPEQWSSFHHLPKHLSEITVHYYDLPRTNLEGLGNALQHVRIFNVLDEYGNKIENHPSVLKITNHMGSAVLPQLVKEYAQYFSLDTIPVMLGYAVNIGNDAIKNAIKAYQNVAAMTIMK